MNIFSLSVRQGGTSTASAGQLDRLTTLGFLGVLAVLPLVWIAPPIQWHDQQRIGQVVLGLLSLILLLRHSHRIPVLTSAVRFALAVIVSLGLLSSLFAHQSHRAFTEVAVFALCLAIALGVAVARHVFGRQADRMLLRTLWLVAAVGRQGSGLGCGLAMPRSLERLWKDWGQVLYQHKFNTCPAISFPHGTPSQTRARRRSLSRHFAG